MRVLALTAVLATSIPLLAMPPLPRKSPEFTITDPSGQETLLSSYKGKVVVIGFIHTTCVHCQAFSAMLNKIQKDLGPRGFQAVDVAWNSNAQALVPMFVKQFGLTFPVGYSDWDPIMSFLGFSVMDRPVVPLIAVIDKRGMIRAESPPSGDPNLQDDAKLRALIESLLGEGSATSKTAKGKR
jgi:thiol-disulfide isomerase/thioredoxin